MQSAKLANSQLKRSPIETRTLYDNIYSYIVVNSLAAAVYLSYIS